ncbi:hypothetical protein BASA81_003597 [Batrachochytrium salamandrivorans]|nr:hypothetical protein BASA81_003597 [Batrachochytrium salamandrivorans]
MQASSPSSSTETQRTPPPSTRKMKPNTSASSSSRTKSKAHLDSREDSALDLLVSAPKKPSVPSPPAGPTPEEQRLAKISRDWEFMQTLPKDLSQIAVSVDDPKTFGATTAAVAAAVMMSDLNGHTRFKITRWMPHDGTIAPQFVRRRHRDFVALSLRLGHCFPELVWPSLSTTTPLSSILGSLSQPHDKNEEFLAVRARRLEAFLTTLLASFPEACQQSPDLAAFLLRDSETFDEIATKYLNNKGQDLEIAPLNITESLQGWVRSSFFSGSPPASASSLLPLQQPSSEPHTADPKLLELGHELSTAYEALNTWIDDKYVAQDRSQGVERLTNALEAVLFVRLAQREFKLQAMPGMFVPMETDSEELWRLVHDQELEFVQALSGRRDPGVQPGPLRAMHSLACRMSGAKDAFHRNLALLADHNRQNEEEEKIALVKAQLEKLRRDCGETTRRVAMDFAQMSLEQAVQERQRLEQIERFLMQEY